jgi:hypothetical protein
MNTPPETDEVVATPTSVSDDVETDLSTMTVTQLKAYADAHGIAYTSSMTKAELIEVINNANS